MKKFEDYNLSPSVQKSLQSLNFETPTDVQKQVLDRENNKDLMVCSKTGSGKTGAYSLPIIEDLLKNKDSQALILAPTRELVAQISDFLFKLTKFNQELKIVTLTGGSDIRRQIRSIKRKPRILVATPGRLNDHLRRKSLSLKKVNNLVLDEGDRMLDMGFAPQLNDIVKFLPKERSGFLFTATLPKKVQELASEYLNNPETITVGEDSLPAESIKQSIVQLLPKEKNQRVLDEIVGRKGSIIVFTRTKSRTDQLSKFLREYGVQVDLIHGDRTQGQRNKAIKRFKEGSSRVLCATDIAARGLDVPQVEHVINFDLPRMEEDYVHRIGRTARNGADGEAISFVTPSDHKTWYTIQKKYKLTGEAYLEIKKSDKNSGGGSRNKKKRNFSRKKSGGGGFNKKSSKKNASGDSRRRKSGGKNGASSGFSKKRSSKQGSKSGRRSQRSA